MEAYNMDPCENFLTSMQVLNWTLDESKVPRLRYVELTQGNQISLIDISLKDRGPQEDKLYDENPVVRINIRRGNSLLLVMKDAAMNIEEKKGNQKKHQKSDEESDDDEIYREMKKAEKARKQEEEKKKKKKLDINMIERAEWVRRGLCKFFDLSFEFLNPTGNIDSVGSFSSEAPRIAKAVKTASAEKKKKSFNKESTRKIIFFDAENAILHKSKTIEVYRTEKANGENVQIAYSTHLKKWIISSKNSCLTAKNLEESQGYDDERFQFAKLIAKAWFSKLESCKNIDFMISEMEGRTLIGEYVGNIVHIHIVRYEKISIQFYAIVDNNSMYSCIPPLEAFYFFKKHGLEPVRVKKVGSFQSISLMYGSLQKSFIEVSEESVEDGGEGSVLYFAEGPNVFQGHIEEVLFGNKPGNIDESELMAICKEQHTLALCKLKTLDYRIIRKIREKAKHFGDNRDYNQHFETFLTEFNQLVEGHELPKPAEFYYNFFKKTYNIVRQAYDSTGKQKIKINYNYVINDIELLIDEPIVRENKIPVLLRVGFCINVDLSMLAKELNYDFQNSKSRIEYLEPETLYTSFHYIDKHLLHERFLFVQVGYDEEYEEKLVSSRKMMETGELHADFKRLVSKKSNRNALPNIIHNEYNRKRQEFNNSSYPNAVFLSVAASQVPELKDLILQEIDKCSEMQFAPTPVKEPEESIKTKIYLVIPIGIPGIGKTYLQPILQKISKEKDLSFKTISSDKIRKNSMETYRKANNSASPRTAFKAVAKEAKDNFKSTMYSYLNSAKSSQMIYLDKCFPPRALKSLFALLSRAKYSAELVTIGIVPESKNFEVSINKSFELSYNLLLTCLSRVLSRKKHETLLGSESEKISVVLSMFNSFSNYSFSAENHFTHQVKIPFANEESELGYDYLQERIKMILSGTDENDDFDGKDFSDVAAMIKDIEFTDLDYTKKLFQEFEKVFDGKVAKKTQNFKAVSSQKTLYLGISVASSFESVLTKLIIEALSGIESRFGNEDIHEDIQSILKELHQNPSSSDWKLSKTLHITTKFFGSRTKPKDYNLVMDEFIENLPTDISIDYLCYSPHENVCLKVTVNSEKVFIENTNPHITIFTGNQPAKYSNFLLDSIEFIPEISSYVLKQGPTVYTYEYLQRPTITGFTKAFH